MNIVTDINHPAHVHFFKYFIQEMKKMGNNVLVTASGKQIVFDLLDYYNINYINFGYYGDSFAQKLLNTPIMDIKMLKAAYNFKPDIFIGLGSIRAAHASWFFRKTSITFEDTEHSKEQFRLYEPFTNIIFTPENYKQELGSKQFRYKGDQKLVYLHPNWFKPNLETLKNHNLSEGDVFSILRFSDWTATHDVNQKGILDKIRFVEELKKHGKIFISAEGELPKKLEKYRLVSHPADIHDLLYYSTLYIGEGASMATEAALLGTPSIYVSSLAHKMGNLNELEDKYSLLYNFTDQNEALEHAITLLSQKDVKMKWKLKKEKLLKDKIDVTAFLIWFVRNYSDSYMKLKENPDLQNCFK